MIPDIQIKTHMFPGYGSARGGYWVRAVYGNILLDEERGGESHEEMGRAAGRMEAKWKRDWSTAEEFERAIEGKPLASRLCDHCGLDTLDGTISVRNKVFCRRCDRDGTIERYKQQWQERDEQARAESDRLQDERNAEQKRSTDKDVEFAYHWRDGWYFKRLLDGGVRILHRQGDYFSPDLTVPVTEWASIVASMSAAGENAETFKAALDAQRPKENSNAE